MYKEKELIIPLYKTIVRPHLEYYIKAWRPYRSYARKSTKESNQNDTKTQEY